MNEFQSKLFENIKRQSSSKSIEPNKLSFAIAYSGGLDSSVLLHASLELLKVGYIGSLRAIHVNHGIYPDSNQWETFCENRCRQNNIPFFCQKFYLAKNNATSELDARKVRYQYFETIIEKGEYLLFAHHQDDQVETLLFRLFRGTGIRGLGGIPEKRHLGKGYLARPLINITRNEIKRYAKDFDLDWVDDPSNLESEYSRNFLRNEVIPLLEKKWPSVSKKLNQFSNLAKEQASILDEVAKQDRDALSQENNQLDCDSLLKLSKSRQKNLIHFWIRELDVVSPSYIEIEQLLSQLESKSSTSIRVKIGNGWARSYDGKLFYLTEEEPEPLTDSVVWNEFDLPIDLPNGIRIDTVEASNIKSNNQLMIRKPNVNEVVSIRPRVGGEIMTPSYRKHTADLKKIYQELKVPSWERKWLPIVYYNEKIVAVPGVFIVTEFHSTKNSIVFNLTK